jgi:hypothetical protein
MTISAQSIVRRVVDTLQDTESVRWSVGELVRYLNDGQREVVLQRPDATSTTITFSCAPGSRQSLPRDGAKLIDIIRNTSPMSTKRALRMVNRELLDAQIPGWRNMPGAVDIVHFVYDPREPRTFYVYPPAASAAQLELIYAALPEDIAEPADEDPYTSIDCNISLPDVFANALQDYILYRAYNKDSEYAGNAQRAQYHYGLFAASLGIEVSATVGAAPNPVNSVARA